MSGPVSSTALNLAEQWQRDFPIVTRPFERMGEALNLTGSEVIAQLKALKGQGILGRVGAAVRPNTIGASTLAAMSVPAERLQEVAETVERFFAETDIDMLSVGAPDFIAALEDAVSKREVTG